MSRGPYGVHSLIQTMGNEGNMCMYFVYLVGVRGTVYLKLLRYTFVCAVLGSYQMRGVRLQYWRTIVSTVRGDAARKHGGASRPYGVPREPRLRH